MYQIVIKNGMIDRGTAECFGPTDLAIEDGKISLIGKINDQDERIGRLTNVIDASESMVVPGLVDMHTHIYPLASFGISAEASCFASGVTTALDCGSAGAANYEKRRGIIGCSRLRIKTLLNVSSTGVLSGKINENVDPAFFDRESIRELAEKYKGEILGLKIRQGAEIVGELGLKPLEATIELAEKLGLPVMVHCTNPPGQLDDMVRLLRKGDVLSHVFMGKGSTILDENQKVSRTVHEARKRGVLMDAANANAHFAFFVAKQALKEGFKPDIISTDQTINSLYRRPNSYNLLHIMSKYLNMGMTLSEVLTCTTKAPAKWLGLESETGEIAAGRPADLAILRFAERPTVFGDYTGVTETANRTLKNVMTIKDGILVYRDQEF